MADYRKITYTADDEEPKCIRCDYFGGGFDCCGSCGAEHGWYGYTRTELEKAEIHKSEFYLEKEINIMVEKNRRYTCNCCGKDYSHEEGLNSGEPVTYEQNGKEITRRTFQCPMRGASKRYADTYLA